MMTHEKEIASVVEKVLRPFLDALSGRDAKNASRTAGGLTFWRDGMRGDLEVIAAGKHDDKTIAALTKKFKESAPRVKHAMDELHRLRGRLAPSTIADQIDVVLHHENFGKGSIRDSIQMILRDLERGGKGDRVAYFAGEVCAQIKTLNAELQKLGRMVRG